MQFAGREEHKNDDKYIFENFSAQEASLKNQLAIAREASAEDNRVLKEYGNELAAAQKALRDCTLPMLLSYLLPSCIIKYLPKFDILE